LCEVRETLFVPAGLFGIVWSAWTMVYMDKCICSYAGAAASIARAEAVDVARDVAECEVPELDAGVVGSLGGSGISLIDVCLLGLAKIHSKLSFGRSLTCVMKKGNVTL
jgi:hypothetical protein